MSIFYAFQGQGFDGPDEHGWQRLLPLLREINDLKRVRAPGIQPSLASAIFRSTAEELFHASAELDADDWLPVAMRTTRAAIVATRLAAIRIDELRTGGLTDAAIADVFDRALEERRDVLDAGLFDALFAVPVENRQPHTTASVEPLANDGQGSWIDRLIAQPRAGATAPGRPRIVIEPVESCAEHCLVTAIYAVLLAPSFGASPDDAFAIGIAHHLHNARLPDAGYAGEALIGEHLADLIATLRSAVLAQMNPDAAERLAPLLEQIATVDTPLARTFHTADTIDRVLQMAYFERCNRFTLKTALVDMELVHAGPIRAFQHAQLDNAGLGVS